MMWRHDDGYARLRQRLDAGDDAVESAARVLRARAAQYCARPAPAVTDKTLTPQSPTTDPHAYVSLGTYWWPHPDTADGLPYVRRDGEISSECARYDRPRWDRAADGIVQTARAACVLRDPRCAADATRRLRRWFLDPATYMAPHLCYAQMIPGRHPGSAVGVIDFALYLPRILEHVTLLAALPDTPWTAGDQHALARWCRDLLAWLETHPYGRGERDAGNNHGTYYDRLVVALALFLGEEAHAHSVLAGVPRRIAAQLAPDGRMPHELQRSCSFGYALMNARGFLDLARLGARVGVDLWQWATDDGRSLPAAIDWLYGRACARDAWPYAQIEPIDWRMLALLVWHANTCAPGRYDLGAMAHRLPAGFDPEAFRLLEPLHPFGEARSPSCPEHDV